MSEKIKKKLNVTTPTIGSQKKLNAKRVGISSQTQAKRKQILCKAKSKQGMITNTLEYIFSAEQ